MDLVVSKNWVESPEYHSLSALAKLALWEVITLVPLDKPASLKELAFKLRLPQSSLKGALSELEDSGFAESHEEDLWACKFNLRGSPVVYEGGARARQKKFHAKAKLAENASFMAGDGEELKAGQVVPIKTKAPQEKVDFQAIAELFRKHCPKMSQPNFINANRERLIKGRWFDVKKQFPHFSKEQTMDFFEAFFEKAGASPFLNGEVGNSNSKHANFRGSLEFLMKPDQFSKVVTNQYPPAPSVFSR